MPETGKKDNAVHLRAVYFALLAACFSLIVLVSHPGREDAKAAAQQLADIRSRSVANWNPEEFQKRAQEQISSKLPLNLQKSFEVQSLNLRLERGAPKGQAPDLQGLIVAMTLRRNWIWDGLTGYTKRLFPTDNSLLNKIKEGDRSAPRNLAEFKEFWNSSVRVRVPQLNQKMGELFLRRRFNVTQWSFDAVDGETQVSNDLTCDVVVTSFPPLGFADPLARTFRKEFEDYTSAASGSVWGDCRHGTAPLTVLLPTDGETFISVDVPDLMMGRQPGEKWCAGSFQACFSALNDITKGYDDLDFEAIRRIIASKAGEPEETIELVGTRVYADVVRRWGIVALLALQIYLWLNLRAFIHGLKSNDSAWDVAWIGIYEDVWARIVFSLSAYLLPLAAAAYLFYRTLMATLDTRHTWWRDRELGLELILLILSTFCAFGAFRDWSRLRDLKSTF
jgi:hypothetical protein